MLINHNDEKIMLNLLEMNIRLAGEKDELEVQKKLKNEEYLEKFARRMLATRCFQKFKKHKENTLSKDELDIWMCHLDTDFKVLPKEILRNVDEWNNDMELSKIELFGTSMKEILEVLNDEDPIMTFLITLECFAMSFWFKKHQNLFLLHTLGQMPVMWNMFPEKKINRRDNWKYYYDLLQSIGKNLTEEQVKRDTLLLDVADKIMSRENCNQHYDECLYSAEIIVDYIPKELMQNVVEFIEDRDFYDIRYDGINIKRYLAERYKYNIYQLEALFGYANDIKWGNSLINAKAEQKITWKEKIFGKKKD